MNHQIEWHRREHSRFTNGEYQPPLWTGEKWWKDIDGHFAHIGVKDKTRIAFTPDEKKGALDRQTAMKPGTYLQQFFGEVLTTTQVRDYAMQHIKTFEDGKLKWAKTLEEIHHVYAVGPSDSCFKGTTKANLYASGDFAVAYIENGERITARALCVPERKIYPYLYGDKCRLETLLDRAGYRLTTSGERYEGLKLLKKWMWRGWYPDWRPGNHVNDENNPDFLITA